MSEKARTKSLKERVTDAVQGVLEAIDELFRPEPQMIPVRIRRPPVPRRRRR